jgi:phosphoribosylglycinamide formyltransferase-1
VKTIILGSGNGTNCQALLDAFSDGLLGTTEIVAVFSDRQNSGILKCAEKAGIYSSYLGKYPRIQENESSHFIIEEDHWITAIKSKQPDLIVLAGFMKIVSQRFIDSFNSKIINLHPSLLPCFRGLNAIKQAWDAGVKITGCTVHWVSSELDGGPIIAQAPVRIMSSDTIESTTAKVQAAEHMLLPSVVADIAHTDSIAKPRD